MTDFDPTEFGRAMGEIVRDAVAPLQARIAELEQALAALPAPPKVSDLISHEGLRTLIELEVCGYMADNPPPPGERGDDGAPGADGVGLAGAMIDRSGALVVTLTNGQLRELGQVVGKDGAPGRDGSDLTALSIDYDGARTLTVKGVAGEVKHCLPIPMDNGYWSDGQFCERHDIVTHDGIAWIALRDTREAPSVAAKEDWRIFARKGRDGKDGRNGIDKTAPVDLEPKPRKP